MTDSNMQRLNMVESQVRPSDVTDRRLIRAIGEVARELYVPSNMASVAYMDGPITIASGPSGRPARQLLAPRAFAKLAQAADLTADSVVLDAGCGTGYSAAVLARVARRVVALEPDAALAAQAKAALAAASADNTVVICAPIAGGHGPDSPYDAIIIEGAVPEVPQSLLDQLKDGGRLVAIVGNTAAAKAVIWTRSGSTYGHRDIFDVAAMQLPGFERAATFAL